MVDALRQALIASLPHADVLCAREQIAPFECDALAVYKMRPRWVVLASCEADVIATIKICARFGVPIVGRGAGTGLSAGAMPHQDGVLLVTTRMNKILALDIECASARVQPGVINAQISKAASVGGLYYAPDPSSQIACSIGGNVAENAGGVHCLKYGVTVHNVLGLRLVDDTGAVLVINGDLLVQPGFDLLALIHGSEGCLGIVTEVTVKLTRSPACTETIMADFNTVAQASAAVAAVIRAGIIPAAMELMDALAVRATEAFCQPGYNLNAAAVMLIDLDGHPLEVAEELIELTRVLSEQGAVAVQVAQTLAERARWWKGRKSAFPAIGRLSPDYYCIDGTVPRRHIGAVLERIAQLSQDFGLPVANVFHAGDGNLHPIIMFDASQPQALEKTEALAAAILESCIAVGGTITGEHGVGLEKINQMAVQFSDTEIAQFLALKRLLDPDNRFNPDKLIPSLARCQEYRAIKSHG